MSNDWHSPPPDLISGDVARAEDLNDKFTAIDVAFDKLPAPHATEKGFAEPIMVGEPTDDGHAVSKNWAETAMTSQVVAAAASATAAASSASSASTSATSASTSASAASSSASTASTAATNAGNSATAASASASSASTSATNAASSASSASTSATSAASSASTASTQASAASTSATNAASSASSASSSASSASSSASSASASATTASTQASNASTSATNAASSASSASTSATNASTSATNAAASAVLAEAWADEDEDVQVTSGKYSAKHWAAKAQVAAAAFSQVTGNTGTATADSNGDALAITGSNGITTTATAGASAALSIAPSYGSSMSSVQAGVAASGGAANTIARSDHVHNIATAAASTLSASTTNSSGSSASLARADHLHTISVGSPSANLTASTTNGEGVAATLARSDHSHAITTGTASTLNATQSNSAGSSASLARADHIHAIATGSPSPLGPTTQTGVSSGLARSDHVHPYPTASQLGVLQDTASNGVVCRTAANTAVGREIVGGDGISVENTDGFLGNPTISVDVPNDVRTSNLTRASTTTLANDLEVDLEAGVHRITGFATFTSASGTPGVKFVFAADVLWNLLNGSIEMSGPASYSGFASTGKLSVNRPAIAMNAVTQAMTASNDYRIEWDFILDVNSPCTFALQWAQNTSSATATERKAGAIMEARKLPQ